jgi:hypothetical protein
MGMEIGVNTLGEFLTDPQNGQKISAQQRKPEIIQAALLADEPDSMSLATFLSFRWMMSVTGSVTITTLQTFSKRILWRSAPIKYLSCIAGQVSGMRTMVRHLMPFATYLLPRISLINFGEYIVCNSKAQCDYLPLNIHSNGLIKWQHFPNGHVCTWHESFAF